MKNLIEERTFCTKGTPYVCWIKKEDQEQFQKTKSWIVRVQLSLKIMEEETKKVVKDKTL